jgi:hypothetical protein
MHTSNFLFDDYRTAVEANAIVTHSFQNNLTPLSSANFMNSQSSFTVHMFDQTKIPLAFDVTVSSTLRSGMCVMASQTGMAKSPRDFLAFSLDSDSVSVHPIFFSRNRNC